ncbi:CbtB-domain containing protein [Candidatus Synechococcus calcipolaris G9]|uniref:CbtB-domain containing protein n=1 Tax=Candidatus Synechococcus calcipolaris G9 TaxID=1497997 RepID=A0ABT6EZ24_9SYNE|nr:CbtB-domain containing protein [Candidatus Synechococcus calcipolaris]MDG2990663.1 CbtB-domain containing protein [Candidatus Synechococcus calcipolaris G9]
MAASTSLWQRTKQITLSVPVQITLLTSLSSLILWTLFFSTYPPVHDALHTTRHNTMGVSCH